MFHYIFLLVSEIPRKKIWFASKLGFQTYMQVSEEPESRELAGGYVSRKGNCFPQTKWKALCLLGIPGDRGDILVRTMPLSTVRTVPETASHESPPSSTCLLRERRVLGGKKKTYENPIYLSYTPSKRGGHVKGSFLEITEKRTQKMGRQTDDVELLLQEWNQRGG